MKNYFLLLLLVSGLGFSQSVNDYKYAVVPAKFQFQKKNDLFGLNTLTKMFMQKLGFMAYLDSETMPMEVLNNNCNKVFVDVIENNGLMATKVKVVLKDCNNKVLFESAEGKSTEKDLQIAYNQALREAFKSFDKLNYKYSEKPAQESVAEKKDAVVLKENFDNKSEPETIPSESHFLNAQLIENGYQLIDTTPKVVLKIYKTSAPDVFIAEDGATKGVLVKNNGQWVFEYYENKRLLSKPINIKF